MGLKVEDLSEALGNKGYYMVEDTMWNSPAVDTVIWEIHPEDSALNDSTIFRRVVFDINTPYDVENFVTLSLDSMEVSIWDSEDASIILDTGNLTRLVEAILS